MLKQKRRCRRQKSEYWKKAVARVGSKFSWHGFVSTLIFPSPTGIFHLSINIFSSQLSRIINKLIAIKTPPSTGRLPDMHCGCSRCYRRERRLRMSLRSTMLEIDSLSDLEPGFAWLAWLARLAFYAEKTP